MYVFVCGRKKEREKEGRWIECGKNCCLWVWGPNNVWKISFNSHLISTKTCREASIARYLIDIPNNYSTFSLSTLLSFPSVFRKATWSLLAILPYYNCTEAKYSAATFISFPQSPIKNVYAGIKGLCVYYGHFYPMLNIRFTLGKWAKRTLIVV